MSRKASDPRVPEAETAPVTPPNTGHDKHGFIVMPSGRDPVEHKWFKGWYEVVIKPAVVESGYDPILAASEEQPGAINDEIRTHLAEDPMVVVDLGGATPEDDPNPNVMYELGIRHALGKPLVIMAWKAQRLPFDVSNQRAIMEARDMLDIDLNRKKLHAFIRAAAEGRYYRPMEAVTRIATIQTASEELGEDSLLRALAQEVRDLRDTMSKIAQPWYNIPYRNPTPTIKHVLRRKRFQKDLFPYYAAAGGTPTTWAKLLRTPLEQVEAARVSGWTFEEWQDFVTARGAGDATVGAAVEVVEQSIQSGSTTEITPDVIENVRRLLPTQPWPSGIHKSIAEQLGLSARVVSKSINILIGRGDFLNQVHGQVVPPAAKNGE
jgi:hypothetical protein